MPSTGTKNTGFALSVLGPFKCGNCRQFAVGVCMDDEVGKDTEIPGYKSRLTSDGKVRVDAEECCNEFYSLKDSPEKASSRAASSKRFGNLIAMGKM